MIIKHKTKFEFQLHRYKVYQVKTKDEASFNTLTKLYNERSDIYDFWTEPRNVDLMVDVMVPPDHDKIFVDLLQAFDMKYRVKITDVQKYDSLNKHNIEV